VTRKHAWNEPEEAAAIIAPHPSTNGRRESLRPPPVTVTQAGIRVPGRPGANSDTATVTVIVTAGATGRWQ
jgi:hypothetical protein